MSKRGLALSSLSPNAQQLRSPKAISTSLAAARRAGAANSTLPSEAQEAIATAEASAASALRTLFSYEERVEAAESAARAALEQRDKAEFSRKAAEEERERYKSACEQICEEFSLFRNATRETMEAQATKAVISQGRHMRAIGALKSECDGLQRRVVSLSDERDSVIESPSSTTSSVVSSSSEFSELDRVSLEGYCSSLVQQVAALHRALVDAEARSAVLAASAANSEEVMRRVAAYESFLVAIGEEAVVDQISRQGACATEVISKKNLSSSSPVISSSSSSSSVSTSPSSTNLQDSPGTTTSPALVDVSFSPATINTVNKLDLVPSPPSLAAEQSTTSAVPLSFARGGQQMQKTLNRAASAMAILSSPHGTTRERNRLIRASHVISVDDPLSSSLKNSSQVPSVPPPSSTLSTLSSSSLTSIPDTTVIVKSLNDALIATSLLASISMPIVSPEKKLPMANRSSSSSSSSSTSSSSSLLSAASAVSTVREALSRSFELAQFFEAQIIAANGRATAAEDRILSLASTLDALRDTVTAHESLASRRASEMQLTVKLLESAQKDRDYVRSLNSKLAETLRRAESSLKALATVHSKLRKGLKKSVSTFIDPNISSLIEKDESELESITRYSTLAAESGIESKCKSDNEVSIPPNPTIKTSLSESPSAIPQNVSTVEQVVTTTLSDDHSENQPSKVSSTSVASVECEDSSSTLIIEQAETNMSSRDQAESCIALSVESLAAVAVEAILAASSAQASISQSSIVLAPSPTAATFLANIPSSNPQTQQISAMTLSPLTSEISSSTAPFLSAKKNQAQNLLYSPSFAQMQFRTAAPRTATSSSSSVTSSSPGTSLNAPPQLWSPGFAGTLFNATSSTSLPVDKKSTEDLVDTNDIALTAALSALLTAQNAQKSAKATLTAAGVLLLDSSPSFNNPSSVSTVTASVSPVPLSLTPRPLTPSAFPPINLLTLSSKSVRSSMSFQRNQVHVHDTILEEDKIKSPASTKSSEDQEETDELVWNVHSSGSVMATSPPERISSSPPPPAPLLLSSQAAPTSSSPSRRSSMAMFAMTVRGGAVPTARQYTTRYGGRGGASEGMKNSSRARSQSSVTAFADASKSAVAVARVRGWSSSAPALHASIPSTPSRVNSGKMIPPETESRKLFNALEKAESGSASEMFSSMSTGPESKATATTMQPIASSTTTTTSLLQGILGVTASRFPPCSCSSSSHISCSGCGSTIQGPTMSSSSLLMAKGYTLKPHKHCSHCLGPFCGSCAGAAHKLLANSSKGGAGALPRICNGCAGGLLLSGIVQKEDELAALRASLLS